MQAALPIEHIRKTEQVLLVGPAAVMEDQQTIGLAVGRPLTVDERAQPRYSDSSTRSLISDWYSTCV